MAKKTKSDDGNGEARAGIRERKGYKKIEPVNAPFWSPWDPKSGDPKTIEGAYMGTRVLPARGKFGEQTVIDVETAEGPYTVALKGNLPRRVAAAKLAAGQMVIIDWLGKAPPSEKLPLGQNQFELWVQG